MVKRVGDSNYKQSVIRPILESQSGIHLTAYLAHRGDLVNVKDQLRGVLHEANDGLREVLTTEEQMKFLEPLENLLWDSRILNHIKGNVGLFRTKNSFRILNLPVAVERQCHIATSFHVKPLLRWMQEDRDFLLLGLSSNSAHLYLGNQTSLSRLDSVVLPRFRRRETLLWIKRWFSQTSPQARPDLYIVGDNESSQRFIKLLKYENLRKVFSGEEFSEDQAIEYSRQIRERIKMEVRHKLDETFTEFRFAEELNLTKKNLFQIAKFAVKGKIKKLVIAEDFNIHGKLDQKTGGLAIHPFDLDHEDDDLLDDIAQTVILAGGEVLLAPRLEIPEGRIAIALIDGAESPKSLALLGEYRKASSGEASL